MVRENGEMAEVNVIRNMGCICDLLFWLWSFSTTFKQSKEKKSRNLLKFTQRVRRSIIKLTTVTSDPYGVYEDPKNIDGAPLENIICRSHIVFIFPAPFLRTLIYLICMQII